MADIEVPDWMEPVLGAVGGQPWPQLSESALVRESEVWEELAGYVRDLEGRFADPAYAAVGTMEGEGAAALKASLDRFVREIGADQELPAFQQIARYMQDTADG
ncbi:hypothetical protein, partial [Streptomyces sp. NPDC056632]|uniref:hypothetical protein n=1 Tax=Streptomyces sp. NPDC056632 TaxID=3345884 RepID=UPI0036B885A2